MNAKVCEGLTHMRQPDGTLVHVFLTENDKSKFEAKAEKAVQAYNARLSKLQQDSRGLFGTVDAEAVVFVLDASESMESSIRSACDKLKAVLREQVAKNKVRFTVLAFAEDVKYWRKEPAESTRDNVADALNWLGRLKAAGNTNTLAALREALRVPDIGAVYLLTDGRPDQDEEQILDFVVEEGANRTVTINTVSFNCADPIANQFLHDLAECTGGCFQYFTGGLGNLQPSMLSVLGPPPLGESEDVAMLYREIDAVLKEVERLRALFAEIKEHDEQRRQGVDVYSLNYRLTEPPPLPPEPRARNPNATLDKPKVHARTGRIDQPPMSISGERQWDKSGPEPAALVYQPPPKPSSEPIQLPDDFEPIPPREKPDAQTAAGIPVGATGEEEAAAAATEGGDASNNDTNGEVRTRGRADSLGSVASVASVASMASAASAASAASRSSSRAAHRQPSKVGCDGERITRHSA